MINNRFGNRIFFMALCLALGLHGVAWGHPPTSVTLTYSSNEKELHIEVKHVSQNKRDHVIGKLTVYKNDVEASTSKFLKQTSATMLLSDISLEAVPGDVLRVKAFCNDAGSREQTLIVP